MPHRAGRTVRAIAATALVVCALAACASSDRDGGANGAPAPGEVDPDASVRIGATMAGMLRLAETVPATWRGTSGSRTTGARRTSASGSWRSSSRATR